MSITVLQFQVKDAHVAGVVIIIEGRNSFGLRENIFLFFFMMLPCSEMHLSPNMIWDNYFKQ